ncbi:MAG: hypothetical protein QGH83_14455 [Candidatus Pacebacteria bacterium]|nr:hypothetical protein [Candidatus Paceibacterota bacterium]
MVEILSEINVKNKITEPIVRAFKKKKESKVLEEQIRETLPCDVEYVELKEKQDEKL